MGTICHWLLSLFLTATLRWTTFPQILPTRPAKAQALCLLHPTSTLTAVGPSLAPILRTRCHSRRRSPQVMLISGALGTSKSTPPRSPETMYILIPTVTSKDLHSILASLLAQSTTRTSTAALANTTGQINAAPTITPKQQRQCVLMHTALLMMTSRLLSSSHQELVSRLSSVQAVGVQSFSLQRQHSFASWPIQAPCQAQAAQIPQLPASRSRILMLDHGTLVWFSSWASSGTDDGRPAEGLPLRVELLVVAQLARHVMFNFKLPFGCSSTLCLRCPIQHSSFPNVMISGFSDSFVCQGHHNWLLG